MGQLAERIKTRKAARMRGLNVAIITATEMFRNRGEFIEYLLENGADLDYAEELADERNLT